MAAVPVYDRTGAHTGEVEVPAALVGEPHVAMLHQAVRAELAGRRQGTSDTKTRGEVAGRGRKLWRQKGTGRARVGDRRPPSRIGGGRVTGPHPRSYDQHTPLRVKLSALRAALGTRVAAGDVVALAAIELPEAKTKHLQGLLDTVGVSGKVLLVLAEHDPTLHRCGRNIRGLEITTAGEVTAYALLAARMVVLTTDAMARLEARLG